MYQLSVATIGSELQVSHVRGEEALSALFRFEVTLLCPDAGLSFADVLGADVELTIASASAPRTIRGIAGRFEQLDAGKQRTSYQLTIVPSAWRLRFRQASRIFQEMTTGDIVAEVLGAASIEHRLSLGGSYRTRGYCVQYRESDWDFLSRLMEEDGIHYYFEHTPGSCQLVIADALHRHEPIGGDTGTLLFRPPSGALRQEEHIRRFFYAEQVTPGKVTLRDYNFETPSLSLQSSSSGAVDTELEIYDHPGQYDQLSDGDNLAGILRESLAVPRKTGRGESNSPRLTPGHVVTLAEHNREDFNQDYLICKVVHEGTGSNMEAEGQPEQYENRFEVIPADVPYRPARRTVRPRIQGIQTAVVVGPAGEEIYTDEHGRVKVQFFWDREGSHDDKSSCWIRVAQIGAGGGYGAMFLPRVGHEVVVDFIEGDPDRPLVVGSVYHAANLPPYALPEDKTRSTIKSNSSPGGDGFNELRFEDKAGDEEIYLHGQKDLLVEIENDKDQTVGGDETLSVKGDRDVVIQGAHTEKIGDSQTLMVATTLDQMVGATMNVLVGAEKSETVGAMSSETVIGLKAVNVGMGYTLNAMLEIGMSAGKGVAVSAGKGVAVSAGEAFAVTAGKDVAMSAGANMTLTVAGDSDEDVTGKRTLVVGDELTITVGDAQIVINSDGEVTIEGAELTIKCDGEVNVEGDDVNVTASGDVNVEADGDVIVSGGSVELN